MNGYVAPSNFAPGTVLDEYGQPDFTRTPQTPVVPVQETRAEVSYPLTVPVPPQPPQQLPSGRPVPVKRSPNGGHTIKLILEIELELNFKVKYD